MNLIKFIDCWWHRRHLFFTLHKSNGSRVVQCIRCGLEKK